MAAVDITTPETVSTGLLHAREGGPLLVVNPEARLEHLLDLADDLLVQAGAVAETVCADLYEQAELAAQHRGDALGHLLGTIQTIVSAAKGKAR